MIILFLKLPLKKPTKLTPVTSIYVSGKQSHFEYYRNKVLIIKLILTEMWEDLGKLKSGMGIRESGKIFTD